MRYVRSKSPEDLGRPGVSALGFAGVLTAVLVPYVYLLTGSRLGTNLQDTFAVGATGGLVSVALAVAALRLVKSFGPGLLIRLDRTCPRCSHFFDAVGRALYFILYDDQTAHESIGHSNENAPCNGPRWP